MSDMAHSRHTYCRSVGAGLLVGVLAVASPLTSGCRGSRKATPIMGTCSQDEETCAGGSGQCVFWGGKQTCLQKCGPADWCPADTHATTQWGYDCFCDPS